MNMRWLFQLPAALLAFAAASPVALAGPTNVPFKGNVAIQETIELFPSDVVCAGSFIKGTSVAIGNATHLGLVSGHGADCANISSGPPNLPSYAITNGELTVTAANGDQLTLTYSGTLTPTTNNPTDAQAAIYAIAGNFRVTSGTGRFAKSTGNGFLTGSENTITRQGYLEFTGSISY